MNTYNDILAAFVSANERIQSIRDQVNCSDVDARNIALRGLQGVLGGYFMSLHSMVFNRNADDVTRSLGTTDLSPEDARKTVEDVWRHGLLTLCHFKIDGLYYNLLRCLGRNPPLSFTQKHNELIQFVGIPLQPSMEVLAKIRNSLHNNGIHRHTSARFQINGQSFDFIQDSPVQCASWPHIFAALNAGFDTLEAILSSPTISSIPSGIVDDFAEEVSAGRAVE